MSFDPKLRTAKESSLFILCALVAAMFWLGVVATIVGGPIALGAALFGLIIHAVWLAHVRGNGVRLSENQLPELFAMAKKSAAQLGLDKVPDVYVLQAGGILNAFATKLLSRNFVVVFSDLVDGCQDPRQIEFVIGHEMGHVAAGHLAWNWFLAPAMLVPWLGPAYSRAREYTCDRCGAHVVGDLEAAQRGLVVLAAGGKLAPKVNLDAFMAQREEAGTFWLATLELVSSHPFLCKRIAALREWQKPGTVPDVERTIWAYPLAPLLGLSGGGASSLVVIFALYAGVLAAIAVPSMMRFAQKAKAEQAKIEQLKHEQAEIDAMGAGEEEAADDKDGDDQGAGAADK